MKFLHTGDLHLGTRFSSEYPLDVRERLKLDEKNMLSNIINLVNEKKIPYLLIAGDLFDTNRVDKKLIEYVISQFERCGAKILIAPGNHDYFCEKSVYAENIFPPNVHVFTDEITSVETDDAVFYGYGFSAPHKNEDIFRGFHAESNEKPSVLITHTDFSSGGFYNQLSLSEIEESGLSYIAAGHIHLSSGIEKRGNTYYGFCGAPQNLSFKEICNATVIIAEISDGFLSLTRESVACHKYMNITSDVSSAHSSGEILDICANAIRNTGSSDILYNLTLTGSLKNGIDISSSLVEEALSPLCLYIRVKEAYVMSYNIDLIKQEKTVRGEYVRQVLKTYGDEDAEFVNHVIEKGVSLL